MSSLENKKLLVAITGGIAAYKIPELVRRLKERGADIRVVMTHGAKAFITPLTLQAVSGNPVADSLLDPEAEAAMGHIELAKWADLIVIAPATADVIAKTAMGLADDLLSTLCLATASPIAIVPAMNQQMWSAKATQHNISVLKSRDYPIWGPGSGSQACGDVGYGRMIEPNEILNHIEQHFELEQNKPLQGQHWVITAGPTREAIDPVRYISNHSSGKMGYALADAALAAGASVSLISGPVSITPPAQSELIAVESANEMHESAIDLAKLADVFIGCAAVADFRVESVADQKIKKQSNSDTMQITMVKNPDIIADVATLEKKPFTVGFAAETQDVEQYAKQKMAKKNLDMIVANDVAVAGQGFNSDNNAVTVFWEDKHQHIQQASKSEIAEQLVALIATQKNTQH